MSRVESNHYEDELWQELSQLASANRISEAQAAHLVERVNARFPFSGSKIDWSALVDAEHVDLRGLPDEEFLGTVHAAFSRAAQVFGWSGSQKIYAIGDSLIDSVYELSLDDLFLALGPLLELPQHHYFVPSDVSCCVVVAMGGLLDFGRAPHE